MINCITCAAEIPPIWSHCINSNICPGCGGQIMDNASKDLLDEIREAMKKMTNDPEGLAGWLLSNYKLQKYGSAEPTEFHKKPSAKESAQLDKLKIANNPVQEMLKRTGIKENIDKNRTVALAAIAKKIKQNSQGVQEEEFEYTEDEFEENQEQEENDLVLPSVIKVSSALVTAENIETNPEDVKNMEAFLSSNQSSETVDEVRELQRRDRIHRQQQIGNGNGSFTRRG